MSYKVIFFFVIINPLLKIILCKYIFFFYSVQLFFKIFLILQICHIFLLFLQAKSLVSVCLIFSLLPIVCVLGNSELMVRNFFYICLNSTYVASHQNSAPV